MTIMRCELDGHLAVITMTNQAKRNVLSEAMIDGIIAGLEQASQAKARVVILRAEPGCKVWSAGHDVSELPAAHRDPLGWSDPLRVVIRAIEEFPAPVIALIEGGVWGGACEVAMACDILVITDHHPRFEDPSSIRAQLLVGVKQVEQVVRDAAALPHDNVAIRIHLMKQHHHHDNYFLKNKILVCRNNRAKNTELKCKGKIKEHQ
jgi:hypothetical protein